MAERDVDLKNPWLAAALAYLIPGAGHLYQRRTAKGVLYLVCILGTFFYGMHLGEWKVVYYRNDPGHTTYGYYSQVLVGLPALPALLQAWRYHPPASEPQALLDEPLEAAFIGEMMSDSADEADSGGRLSGTVRLKPVAGQYGPEVRGTFSGTLDGESVELPLAGPLFRHGRRMLLGSPLAADSRRRLVCRVVEPNDGSGTGDASRLIEGTISRSFWNSFEVPLTGEKLESLHRRLGKRVELAFVYTWIAGLLNILAIWDALEGPAYGFSPGIVGEDEETDRNDTESDEKTSSPAGSPKDKAMAAKSSAR